MENEKTAAPVEVEWWYPRVSQPKLPHVPAEFRERVRERIRPALEQGLVRVKPGSCFETAAKFTLASGADYCEGLWRPYTIEDGKPFYQHAWNLVYLEGNKTPFHVDLVDEFYTFTNKGVPFRREYFLLKTFAQSQLFPYLLNGDVTKDEAGNDVARVCWRSLVVPKKDGTSMVY